MPLPTNGTWIPISLPVFRHKHENNRSTKKPPRYSLEPYTISIATTGTFTFSSSPGIRYYTGTRHGKSNFRLPVFPKKKLNKRTRK